MSGKEGQSDTIFSSTGDLGVHRRHSNRLYVVGSELSSDPQEFSTNYHRLIAIEEKHPTITRGVFKGVVSNEVLSSILVQPDVHKDVEVVVPLAEYGMPDSSLVYLGHNSESRRSIVPVGDMVEATSEQVPLVGKSPYRRIAKVVEQGYKFKNSIEEEQADELFELWGKTFGWDKEQILGFIHRLKNERAVAPSNRSLWFSGIVNEEGRLIGASMAERQNLPGADDNKLPCVESTEWRVHPGYTGKRLMSPTITMLNAQILNDLGNDIFIFAECNYIQGAHVTGHQAGFQLPSREVAEGIEVPQILVQNVGIKDGSSLNGGKFRDFVFMQLKPEAIDRYYKPESRQQMLKNL